MSKLSIKSLFTKILNRIAEVNTSLSTIEPKANNMILLATCSTAAGTAAKVASFAGSPTPSFTLAAGVSVAVTFRYGNSAATPTLNVGGTGEAEIVVPYTTTAFSNTYTKWGARETILFTYNGTQWVRGISGLQGYELYSSKADLASPTFTGTPKAPTATAGTNTTQIATTAFVKTATDNAVANIGTTVTNSNSSAVPIQSGIGKSITSVALTQGKWVLLGKVRFTANTSGVRRLNISTTSGATSVDVQAWPVQGSSSTTDMQVMDIVSVGSGGDTYHLNAYQNSGSELSCAANIGTLKAIRIA